jgi:5-methyltetrahydrofolate--homocysteine methyltransferase
MVGMIEDAVRAAGSTPVVAQPNAGQPITTPAGIRYDANPDAFAADLAKMLDAGARIVGGCCGTDETFIRTARAAIDARSRG